MARAPLDERKKGPESRYRLPCQPRPRIRCPSRVAVPRILPDAEIGQRKRTISDMAGPVLTPAFSPDGQTLAAAGGYQTDGAKTTGEMRLLRVK